MLFLFQEHKLDVALFASQQVAVRRSSAVNMQNKCQDGYSSVKGTIFGNAMLSKHVCCPFENDNTIAKQSYLNVNTAKLWMLLEFTYCGIVHSAKWDGAVC